MIEKNHCSTTFKYIKPLKFKTTPALKDSEGHTDVFIKAKEVLIHKSAFLKPLPNIREPLIIFPRIAHTQVTEETITQA